MITLKTPTKQIVKELLEEEDKAIYWLKKKYHGEKGYEAMQEQLCRESEREKKNKRSEIIEYISKNGNRWLVYEHCKYYESIKHAYSMPVAFCYYETLGSCGAYVVAHSQFSANGDACGAIMFTDHFFLRFSQRLGVQVRSKWMLQRFIEVIPGFMFEFGGKNEYGYIKVDCRLPASLGRGILRKDGDLVEIRSYLTDKQLNPKQLRETEHLRTVADKQSYEPIEVKQVRMLMSGNFNEEFEKEILNTAEIAGVDKGKMIAATNLSMYVMNALIDLGYADPHDIPFWKRCSNCINASNFLDIVDDMDNGVSEKEIAKKLYDIIVNVGSYMSIKKYNAEVMMNKTIENWQSHYDEYLKQNPNYKG